MITQEEPNFSWEITLFHALFSVSVGPSVWYDPGHSYHNYMWNIADKFLSPELARQLVRRLSCSCMERLVKAGADATQPSSIAHMSSDHSALPSVIASPDETPVASGIQQTRDCMSFKFSVSYLSVIVLLAIRYISIWKRTDPKSFTNIEQSPWGAGWLTVVKINISPHYRDSKAHRILSYTIENLQVACLHIIEFTKPLLGFSIRMRDR